ncbi:CDP-alcohol phosphatidyltransferase family protein [soil metagenome]
MSDDLSNHNRNNTANHLPHFHQLCFTIFKLAHFQIFKLKKHIPNIVTLMNMACGCAGIAMVFGGMAEWAPFMIFAGAIFDFFDGFVARAFKADSELGKQLDSMSDLVTFGVLPATLLLVLLNFSGETSIIPGWHLPIVTGFSLAWHQTLPLFIVTLGAGYRLAKFNIDTRQTTSFLGLPSPANGIFFAALFLGVSFGNFPERLIPIILSPITLYSLAIVFALLMVSEIPMFAMKVKGYGWKGNEFRYALLILSLPLIVFFQFAGLSLCIILYILLSIIQNLVKR